MNIHSKTTKEVGALGEALAGEYLKRHGFRFVDKNVLRKTGELDLIYRKGDTLHFVEVKTIRCEAFPVEKSGREDDSYDPSVNLHEAKIRKVARTAEWYAVEHEWEGDWQVDACLVWLRTSDGMGKVRYLPQIV